MAQSPLSRRAQEARSDHTGPFHAEGENLAFQETSGVGTEVSELVDLDARFESEDAFHMREGVAVALKMPKAEELVIEAGWR